MLRTNPSTCDVAVLIWLVWWPPGPAAHRRRRNDVSKPFIHCHFVDFDVVRLALSLPSLHLAAVRLGFRDHFVRAPSITLCRYSGCHVTLDGQTDHWTRWPAGQEVGWCSSKASNWFRGLVQRQTITTTLPTSLGSKNSRRAKTAACHDVHPGTLIKRENLLTPSLNLFMCK